MTATGAASRRRLPPYAWLGLAILIGAELAILGGVGWVATWFTPIQWTGYILVADGIVRLLVGDSWLTSQRREFPLLAILSVGIWLVFEAYNFHLRNWYYDGLPRSLWLRNFGYLWSFATILPGIVETADLVGAVVARRRPTSGWEVAPHPAPLGPTWVVGLVMVLAPLVAPAPTAAYLFAFVWVGFIFVLDPINAQLGAPSLLERWKQGDRLPVFALLVAGLLCGFLWETWNIQAFRAQGAYWVYTVPQALRIFGWHFGQMPVLGLLGFPPFALEMFAWYHFLRRLLGGDHIFASPAAASG